MSNTFYTSDGIGVSKPAIDQRVRRAKAQVLEDQRTEYGYNFCEDCGIAIGRLDCSHDISVDQCQKQGKTELAWDIENITIRCRLDHIKHDNK